MQRQYGRWYRSANTQRMIRHSRRRHIRHACISQNKVLRDRCYFSYQYSTVNVAYIESFQRYSQMLQKNKHFHTPILLNLLFIMWSVHWRPGQWCAIKIYILHNITELPYPQPAPPPKKKDHWRWFEGCAGWLTQWRFYANFMDWYWRD